MEELKKIPHYNFFMEVAKSICKHFVIDNDNREVIKKLLKYFNRMDGELDLKKGIWLEGDLGTGKSLLLNIFSQYLIRKESKGFLVHSCPQIATLYIEGEDLDKYTYQHNERPPYPVDMGFDELGREPIPVFKYKTELNIMQHILSIRYNIWQSKGVRTHITTNKDAEEIEELYGDFIRDRRREMFNIIPLTGESRR